MVAAECLDGQRLIQSTYRYHYRRDHKLVPDLVILFYNFVVVFVIVVLVIIQV